MRETFVDVPAGGDITLLRFEVANEAVQSVPETKFILDMGGNGCCHGSVLILEFSSATTAKQRGFDLRCDVVRNGMYLTHETCWSSRTLLGAMLLLVVASCAHGMTIDIFSAQQGPADDVSNGGGGAISNMPGPQAGNVVPFSGSRTLFAEKTSEAIGRARLQVHFDVLFYSSSSGVRGQFEVAYLDLGGIDLTFGDGLTILGELDASAAAGGGTRLGLYVEDISANFARSGRADDNRRGVQSHV